MKSQYLSGPIVRTRKSQKHYNSYRKEKPGSFDAASDTCVFCDRNELANPIERDHFLIIQNRFKYDVWDGCRVLDHLMIIPKRHVTDFGQLSSDEKISCIDLLAKYERSGYSVYSRAVGSATRTVDHLHTHLIKLDPRPIRGLVYLTKPHVLLYKK